MDKNKQISSRHHFVPEFYLKPWRAKDGKGLWVYQRDFNGQVKSYRRVTKSVGCVKNLYTLLPDTNYSVLNFPQDAIEQGFFSLLDDNAAKVHRKLILSGINGLTQEEKKSWALFVNSLLERSPSRIEEVQATDPSKISRDDLIKKWGHSELVNNINFDAMYENSIRLALIDQIRNGAFIKNLTEMRWVLICITVEGEHFLTSDMPVTINAGRGGAPIHCLSLPISPSQLLVIHENGEEFDDDFMRTLAVVHSVEVMRQAKKYVVSSRRLDDGPYTKYSRAIQSFLVDPRGQPNENLPALSKQD